MQQKPDINRLIDFQQLLIRFHGIERRVYLSHTPVDRPETDTEHSYSLAMAGWFLVQYFPQLDANKVIRLALAHDLLEIHAGDTPVFDTTADHANKKAREASAAKQLATEWSDFPELHASIAEYEHRQTAEAKFVYALDKLMPALLNYLLHGDVWDRLHVTYEQFRAEKEAKIPASPEIYEYYQQLLQILHGHLDYFATEGDSAA